MATGDGDPTGTGGGFPAASDHHQPDTTSLGDMGDGLLQQQHAGLQSQQQNPNVGMQQQPTGLGGMQHAAASSTGGQGQQFQANYQSNFNTNQNLNFNQNGSYSASNLPNLGGGPLQNSTAAQQQQGAADNTNIMMVISQMMVAQAEQSRLQLQQMQAQQAQQQQQFQEQFNAQERRHREQMQAEKEARQAAEERATADREAAEKKKKDDEKRHKEEKEATERRHKEMLRQQQEEARLAQAENEKQRKLQSDQFSETMLRNLVVRASVPTLDQKTEYPDWKFKVEGEIERLSVTKEIAEKMKGKDIHLDPVQTKKLHALGAEVKKQLKGAALQRCNGINANDIIKLLTELERWAGESQSEYDKTTTEQRFTQENWDPKKMGLEAWVAEKFRLARLLPETCPEGPIMESRMRAVLLGGMPKCFDPVVSRLRTKPPATWQEIEKELVDWDKTESGKDKDESKPGSVFVTLEDVQSQIKDALDKNSSTSASSSTNNDYNYCEEADLYYTYGKSKNYKGGKQQYGSHPYGGKGKTGKPKQCWYCWGYNHTQYECRKKAADEAAGKTGNNKNNTGNNNQTNDNNNNYNNKGKAKKRSW